MATMEKMFGSMMGGGGGKGSKKKGGSRRKKGGGGGGMPSMAKMNQMYEQILKETLKDFGKDLDLGGEE